MTTLTLVNAALDVALGPLTIVGGWFMFRQLDALAAAWTAYKAR
jgi:hypothetical protein